MMTTQEYQQLRRKVFEKAGKEQTLKLILEDMYGTPHSFWRLALQFKLITKEEYKKVHQHVGKELWDYRGD